MAGSTSAVAPGHAGSRKSARTPHVSIHLDGLDEIVIIDGEATILSSATEDLAVRLAAASVLKYPEYGVTPEVYRSRGAIEIRPRKVVAWTDITKDPTRFSFD